ncbi:TraB/GumN family protein [Wenzhouxiangella sp. EGI_FJ10305]|uniref:TraB/GumN family protein n=1 Tax=Wenzhouxiangella sp. EGI_FJ10305 TaxID=3243768 RepID=UPI0035DB082E
MHRLPFDHRRIRTWAILLALALLPAAAPAQVFWSVTDDNGRQNWLLGTMHSEDPRLLEWPEPLVDAMGDAERIALELVPDSRMLERLQRAMASEQPLDEVLDAELHGKVVDILTDKYGMTRSAVNRLRPWAVALTLATPPPETGMYMDLMISYRAQGAGLDVVPLETVDEQIDFLAGLSMEDQLSLIRETVDDHGAHEAVFEQLVSAYLDGDLQRLDRLAEKQMAGLDERIVRYFDERGLAARNRRMLERADPWLEVGGLIIAVGALHLQGDDGLVELLRERGWQVEAIY